MTSNDVFEPMPLPVVADFDLQSDRARPLDQERRELVRRGTLGASTAEIWCMLECKGVQVEAAWCYGAAVEGPQLFRTSHLVLPSSFPADAGQPPGGRTAFTPDCDRPSRFRGSTAIRDRQSTRGRFGSAAIASGSAERLLLPKPY